MTTRTKQVLLGVILLIVITSSSYEPASDWQLSADVAHLPISDRHGIYKVEVGDSLETVTLFPYGCTRVRIVAFPVVP